MFDRAGSRKYLNRRERLAFLRAAKKERDPGRRSFALTMLHTGCRISEALNILVGRIDGRSMAITFETLKRRKSGHFRAVPIPDDLAKLLMRLTRGRLPIGRIWTFSRPTGYRLIVQCMRRAKISGGMACPKGLRHGFGVACVEQKIPLPIIQKWLGHAKPETTAIYLCVMDLEERNLARRLWVVREKNRKSACKTKSRS
jgi:integrase